MQGAGDDDENWARGLTAAEWWEWRVPLLERAVRSHEVAEEVLVEWLEARRATNQHAAAASSNGLQAGRAVGKSVELSVERRPSAPVSERRVGEALDVSDGAAAEAEWEAGFSATNTAAATAAPATAAHPLPCELFGSGLIIGCRRSAAPPAVWERADAVLDVGSAAGGWAAASGERSALERRADDGDAGTLAQQGTDSEPPSSAVASGTARYLHLPVEDEGEGKSKRAQPSKDWWQRRVLPCALRYLDAHLKAGHKVMLTCERGDDRSATVAAAALLALYDPSTWAETGVWNMCHPGPPGSAARPCRTKEEVRACLAMVQGEYPAARISRNLAKELNNFFVAPGGGWQRVEFDTGLGADVLVPSISRASPQLLDRTEPTEASGSQCCKGEMRRNTDGRSASGD